MYLTRHFKWANGAQTQHGFYSLKGVSLLRRDHTPQRGDIPVDGVPPAQWQLPAFARAITRKPSVLAPDEATAFMDSATGALIRSCDRIFVLSGGQILEHGSHDQLMALGGEYARLVPTSE